MKTIKILSFLFIAVITLTACSKNDDGNLPEPVNEEEVITTLTATLTPDDGGTVITLQTRDLDGDGPNPPEVTISGDFTAETVYNGTIEILNETVSPAEDITLEVEEESNEHQFIFTVGSGLDITTNYENFDSNGDLLGTEFSLRTGIASSGNLTFTLRHEPMKPNDGTLADAGGETDVSATFNVTVQ